MVIKSYAKINLSLNVSKRLNNGLHNIQSLFCLINLFDEISIKKQKRSFQKDKVFFSGQFAKDIKLSDNSIQKVLNILRKKKLISNFYSIKVKKNIPVFAGLGGGSSNGYAILNYFLKKGSKDKIINTITKHIGSDLRLFFYKKGFLSNINRAIRLKNQHKLHFLIVFPRVKCKTALIYSEVKKYSPIKKFFEDEINSRSKFTNYIFNSKNDLQSIVEKRYQIVGELISDIRGQKGCYISRMTGSGSTCFGLFINENCSKVALNSLKKKYPKFWFSIAKTI